MALELIEAARWLRFDPESGWPTSFNHWQLAALQMDRAGKDVKSLRTAQRDWERLIELAIDGGTLEHQSSTVRTMVRAAMSVKPPAGFVRNWGGGDHWPSAFTVGGTRFAYTKPAEYKDVTHHHIAATAFAAWLTSQGIEPSAHIAAWFKACGVGAHAAPVIEPARPALVNSTPVNQVPGRVPEKARAPDWTGERLLAKQQEHKAAGLRDYTSRVATEAGLSVREVNRRIAAVTPTTDRQKRA